MLAFAPVSALPRSGRYRSTSTDRTAGRFSSRPTVLSCSRIVSVTASSGPGRYVVLRRRRLARLTGATRFQPASKLFATDLAPPVIQSKETTAKPFGVSSRKQGVNRMRSRISLWTFGRPTLLGLLLLASPACDPGDGVEDRAGTEASEQPFTLTTGIYDSGTTCTTSNGITLHCCPSGRVMIGANLSQNRFKCATITGGVTGVHGDGQFGTSFTRRNNMHACPSGEVMVGYFQARNFWLGGDDELLLCGKPSTPIDTEQQDNSSSDGQMHVCPEKESDGKTAIQSPWRFAMTGIHAGQNRFSCAR
jgi:hypothetical protein